MDNKLRDLWAQVLDVDASDIEDDTNFFEAGGDSVAAVRLVAAAQAIDISVDIRDVFDHPTLSNLAGKCQEADHSSKSEEEHSVGGDVSILDPDTVDACACACRVDRDAIEDIFPTSLSQRILFNAGKSSGSFRLQWVFRISGNLDRVSLMEAWDRLQKRIEILRTRLVDVGDDMLQVVLKSDMEWQEGNDLAEYKRKSLSQPIKSGQPLFHYAFITQGDDRFFVWTAQHGGFDGWTRRVFFEHLHESLSQPLQYAQKPNTTSYKSLISWSRQAQDKSSSIKYWESVLEGFNKFGYIFPLSTPKAPTTNCRLLKSWPRESKNRSKFTMAAIAHSAWAISLGNISGLNDILFSTIRSGRYIPIPGVESICGPMYVLAPVRTTLDKAQPLGDFLQSMQTQLVSMTQHERQAREVLMRLVGTVQISQTYFSYHARGDDVLSKDLAFEDQGGESVVLQPRRELSTPFTASFGLMLDVYEQENELDLHFNWDDGMRSRADVELLVDDFVENLDQLVRPGNLAVGDLWPGEGRRWKY